jgi:SAM-dependent methyltransferase
MARKSIRKNSTNKDIPKININQYKKIKELYDQFHINMLSNGRLMVKDTGIGYWGITPSSELFDIFVKTQLHKHKKFLDLGSGDGRAALIAKLFTQSTGIEYDSELHNFALDFSKKVKVKPKLLNDDYMKYSFKNYDYIFINPDSNISDYLEQKLLNEMNDKAKLVIYGPLKNPKRMVKINSFDVDGSIINVFQKPQINNNLK